MGSFSVNFMANYLNSLSRFDPDGEAVIYGDLRITWSELRTRVMKLASSLVRLGVNKNDKIAFLFYNSPEFIETNLAIQVAGAIPVPVNYRFTKNEMKYQVDHSDAIILIFDSVFEETVRAVSADLQKVRYYIRKNEGSWDQTFDYDKLLAEESAKDPCVETIADDIAVIIYTGGTTGFPKGVMLTYQSQINVLCTFGSNLPEKIMKLDLKPDLVKPSGSRFKTGIMKLLFKVKNQSWMRKVFEFRITRQGISMMFEVILKRPDLLRFLYPHKIKLMFPSMPLFHDASYVLLMSGVIIGNFIFVIPTETSFDVKEILETIGSEQVKVMANVPTGWKKIVSYDQFSRFDVSSLKIGITGSGVTSVDLKLKIFEKFPGLILADAFGQTEMITASMRIDTGPETLKNRSVGKAMVETKIMDDIGNEVKQGEIGEICYKSKTAMKGYYKEDAIRESVLKDGWMGSGDLGFIDEEGEIRLVDRKKECINTGGEKVYPLEVEEVIYENSKVENVCVIGVPSEEWGHQVHAVVQLKKGESATPEEIMTFCREKLAGYKICKSVTFVDKMPLSPVGKIRRGEIKKQYGSLY